MPASWRISPQKLQRYATIALPLVILVIILADIFVFDSFNNGKRSLDLLKMHKVPSETEQRLVQPTASELHGSSAPPARVGGGKKVTFRSKNKLKPEVLGLFNSTEFSRRFDSRVEEFFSANQCRAQIFMTWFAPVDSFGERESFAMESLFQTNPGGCLVIVSRTLDSRKGYAKVEPLVSRGYRIQAISPDLWDLLRNTPGEAWLSDIKNGTRDPGKIPLPQNLSNLIRLAVLYRYGGVYLDTDFIVLKDLSDLRNSIGAQSADANGNWTRLNNALLVFDKNHPLVYKFIEEFATTFNGNKWGNNGPYLVSRVVSSTMGEIQDFNFTVEPTSAFYPVDWIKIGRFFARPNDTDGEKWVDATVDRLHQSSYALHLWNSQSRKFQIEEGSIIWKLFSKHCVLCRMLA